MYKEYFTHSLKNLDKTLAFQAHSHHLWPDIAYEGMKEYWKDSTTLIDKKWNKIFNEVIPKSQNILKNLFHLEDPNQIVFAPNSHELSYRFLSSFDLKNLKILTTDSEFYSLDRQLRRFHEEGTEINFFKITHGNSYKLKESLLKEVEDFKPDIIILSQCFFNSGFFLKITDLESLCFSIDPDVKILIDGYHSLFTRPMSLYHLAQRAYITGGGYKYAMAGEGACFLITPTDCNLRPKNTGWMAEIQNLSNMKQDKVFYPQDASKFSGSTFEPSGLYRLNAVWDLFIKKGITLEKIHKHVLELQNTFLEKTKKSLFFKNATLLLNDRNNHAHFIAVKFIDEKEASEAFEKLTNLNILIDKRKNILRFGFSIYQSLEDVEEMFQRLS